jgi:hypothetical protein
LAPDDTLNQQDVTPLVPDEDLEEDFAEEVDEVEEIKIRKVRVETPVY